MKSKPNPVIGDVTWWVIAAGILFWTFLGAYGGFHLISDNLHHAEDAELEYLVCYRIQRELARDSLPSTEVCEPPS